MYHKINVDTLYTLVPRKTISNKMCYTIRPQWSPFNTSLELTIHFFLMYSHEVTIVLQEHVCKHLNNQIV